MTEFENLKKLNGRWSGKNRLWHGGEPANESMTTASVARKACETILVIDYTWMYEQKTEEGALLLACGKDTIQGAWIDSWHLRNKIMACTGGADGENAISIKGFYAAPPGPDWGWRTVIKFHDERSFGIVMFNVAPDGKEELAVEADYLRLS